MSQAHTQPRSNDGGATAVEYALMVGLIALVIVAAVVLLGGNLNELFADPALSAALDQP